MKKIIIPVMACLVLMACGGGSSGNEQDATQVDMDIDSGIGILSEASLKYDDLLEGSSTEDDAKNGLVDWLKGRGDVEDAGISDDGHNIWFNGTNGINMNILVYPKDYTENPLLKSVVEVDRARPAKAFSKALDSSMPGANWLYMYVPFMWEQTAACYQEGIFDGFDIQECSSIDNFPYVEMYGIRDLSKYYTDPNSGMSTYAVPYIDEAASLEAIGSVFTMALSSQAHVFIHTHGGISSSNGESFAFFLTGEEITSSNFMANMKELVGGKLSVGRYGGKNYFAITPIFVKEHFAQMSGLLGVEPSFHVYVAACKSYHGSMIKAFMDSGAKSYSGYTGFASHQFVYDSMMSFYSSLSSGASVKDAIDSVTPGFDSLNPLTELKTTVASEKERYFNRIFFEFSGSDYETPPVQKLALSENLAVTGLVTDQPEDGSETGSPVGTIFIDLPSSLEGEYKIEMDPVAEISFVDNATGKQWIASKECIDEDPLCLCSGTITIDYADAESGGIVEGSFDAVLVDKDNVTVTETIKGTFSVIR